MSDYLDPNNEELLKDFFSEAQMQVDTLEQNILVLENDGTNKDAVDEIFRAAHTLKGGSATVEMSELSHFTHLVEDVLDAIRSNKVVVTEDVVDALLAAIDIIKEMLEERMNGAVYKGDTSQMESQLTALISGGAKPAPKAVVRPTPPPVAAAPVPSAPVDFSLSQADIQELLDSAEGGMPVFEVAVQFDQNSLMNTVGGIQCYAALKNQGTILRTLPEFEMLYEDTFFPVVNYYIVTNKTKEELAKYVTIPDVTLSSKVTDVQSLKASDEAAAAPSAGKGLFRAASSVQTAATAAPLSVVPQHPVPQPSAPQPPAKADIVADSPSQPTASALGPQKVQPVKSGVSTEDSKRAGKEAGSVLRVESKRIDDLLNLVSETVITKATFNQISIQFAGLLNELHAIEVDYREKIKDLFDSLPDFLENIQEGRSVKEIRKEIGDQYGDIFTLFDGFETNLKTNVSKFRSTSQNLGRITGELQEGVMRIRMVPISQIFSRFPRLVRDLSKTLNKKINLVIEGEETELDKSVIDDLLDPIMHTVRNSVDHGIESLEERRDSEKPEEGKVLLKASNEGNMIIIEIADDGKGIDVEAVKAKAIERGIISPNKILSDVEAFNLIFEPGFSTAKEITSISGRGVGLDVVRRSIEKLNGSVTVTSEKGKGTRFVIKLPLTLAIIQGLLVRVGEEIYSIPITSVIESLRITPKEIRFIDNYEVFNIRSDVISLLRLNRIFGIKTEEKTDYCFIVIVGTAEKKMGFMVDSLIGEEDVVIKPLRDQFTNSPGIAGASILGDDSVSLIIDVSQLLELGQRKELEQRRLREGIQ
jgi:two-component system chemotaxis sensor kinase CheA